MSNAGGVGRNRYSEPIWFDCLCYAAIGYAGVVNSVAGGGHRLASYDTSLVVSGGVDCERRRRNVYDKKPQRYANDNRTWHLTARSDKSVAYVTNNKNLAIANRSRVSCAHNTLSASVGLNITL